MGYFSNLRNGFYNLLKRVYKVTTSFGFLSWFSITTVSEKIDMHHVKHLKGTRFHYFNLNSKVIVTNIVFKVDISFYSVSQQCQVH